MARRQNHVGFLRMKNLLIYINQDKKFDKKSELLARIQIDNSLDLGWKKEDLIIATNFSYKYNGITSLLVPDNLYYEFDKNASKLPVMLHLIDQGIIDKENLFWCHDLDAYENTKIAESKLGLENYDLGLTHYFYKPEWQFGSLFFRRNVRDIFELLDSTIRKRPHSSRNNEKALTKLIAQGAIDNKRFKKLNVTYNIMKRCLATIYKEAEKPLKVLHFSPWDYDAMMPDTALNMFMYGKNRLKIPLMSDRLIKIFAHHGVK